MTDDLIPGAVAAKLGAPTTVWVVQESSENGEDVEVFASEDLARFYLRCCVLSWTEGRKRFDRQEVLGELHSNPSYWSDDDSYSIRAHSQAIHYE